MNHSKYYQRTTVGLSKYTKEVLNARKKVGQTYDSLVQELIEFWDSKHREYWTRRRAGLTKSNNRHNNNI